MQTIV